jgi:hypothetical protein
LPSQYSDDHPKFLRQEPAPHPQPLSACKLDLEIAAWLLPAWLLPAWLSAGKRNFHQVGFPLPR